ncbi:L10-interacting MYB domain-containing protein-like isoform X2 [Triticum dicoccoides]|nr:L10-interacting MYB domain-containing protein-like isoform X2 [Triticum dicoccoides]
MPSTHLTPSAYDEVGKEFLMRTGLEYTPKQVRNKWTKLKREYNTFKKLKLRETGGGWDFEKNTVKQDNEWWKKAKVDLPGCGKFKKHGLRNEEGLRILFEDISVDGTDHWNPASGLPPPSSSALKTTLNVDEITDLDLEDDTEEQPSPTVASSSKMRLGVTIPEKNKKPKTAQVMQEEIRKISSIAQASHTSFQSFLKKDETVSVASTMDLVPDCGVIDGTDEHFIATELFLKREQREMFLHMTSDSRKGCQFRQVLPCRCRVS